MIFQSGVHYGDLKGSASADWIDFEHGEKFLAGLGVTLADGEHIVGISMWTGEKTTRASVDIFIVGRENYKAGQEEGVWEGVRKVSKDLTREEFFGLFKQFSLTISVKKWEAHYGTLEGKEFEPVEELDLDDVEVE